MNVTTFWHKFTGVCKKLKGAERQTERHGSWIDRMNETKRNMQSWKIPITAKKSTESLKCSLLFSKRK
jgi:hypothetical protein